MKKKKKLIHHDQVGFIPRTQGFFNIHKSINMIHHINKLKDKNHMTISIDVEKAFDKIQHLFIIKMLQKMSIEGTYLNMIKAIYGKAHSKHYPEWWKTESIPPKIRNKARVSTFTTIIQQSSQSPGYNNQRRKINQRNPHWKRRCKDLTVADDMILYIENPNNSIRKLLQLISEFSKVAGYKINT